MSSLQKLEAGWLEKSMEGARRALHSTKTPMELIKLGMKVTLPLSEEDEKKLYQELNSHFYKWTGKQLSEVSK